MFDRQASVIGDYERDAPRYYVQNVTRRRHDTMMTTHRFGGPDVGVQLVDTSLLEMRFLPGAHFMYRRLTLVLN